MAQKVKTLLTEQTRADQEGEPSSPAAPDNVHAQSRRLAKQAARIANFLAENEPQRGKRGKAGQRNVTDNDSAKMQTAHGVIQGYNGQALVEANHHVILDAEACGNGQDDGPVAPMLEGAKAHGTAIGLPQHYFEGTCFSADRNSHRAANRKPCVQETLAASIPDPHFRPRDPRFATQERHKPHPPEKFTCEDFTYDQEHEGDVGPNDKFLQLEARRHKIGNNLYRRDEADAADCPACPLREKC